MDEVAEASPTADDAEGTVLTEQPGEPEPEPAETADQDESVELPARDEPDDAEHQEPVEEPVEEPVDEVAEASPTADDAEGTVVTERPGEPEPESGV